MSIEVGRRVQNIENFAEEAEDLLENEAELVKIQQQIIATEQEIADRETVFYRRPLISRLLAGSLDKLKMKPVVPRRLHRRIRHLDSLREWQDECIDLNFLLLNQYGSNMAGVHKVESLTYNRFTRLPSLPFTITTSIPLPGAEDRSVECDSEYLNLRYVSSEAVDLTLTVPEDDNEEAILNVPAGTGPVEWNIFYYQQGRGGSSDFKLLEKPALWVPAETQTPLHINVLDFDPDIFTVFKK